MQGTRGILRRSQSHLRETPRATLACRAIQCGRQRGGKGAHARLIDSAAISVQYESCCDKPGVPVRRRVLRAARAHSIFFWPFGVEVLLLHVCYPGSMTAPIVEYNSGVLVKEFQVTRGCDVDCVRRSPSVRTRPFAPSRYTKMKTAATSYFPSRLLRDSAVRHHPPVCMPLPALLAAYSCRASTTGPVPPTAPRSTAPPVQPSLQATCSSSKTQARSVAVGDCAASSSTAYTRDKA